ncbi:hypothetical protein ATANTOWER_028508 [Ataeniobius toweri]|uniref:Uncharacterized protein n=1 Tax=Ataeniobius toweri TaxID=208326 RepID=A0ABU7A8E5_9TELE|nr:hypothetical protein [Ataeniobius toweri]
MPSPSPPPRSPPGHNSQQSSTPPSPPNPPRQRQQPQPTSPQEGYMHQPHHSPVEEFMSCLPAKRHQRACLPYPVPFEGRVEDGGCSNSCAFIWAVASQEVRSYPVSWLCQKKVNAFYFEKFQKSLYRSLMLKYMAGSQQTSVSSWFKNAYSLYHFRFLRKKTF